MSKFSLRWEQLPTDLRALVSSAGFERYTITPNTLESLKKLADIDLTTRERVTVCASVDAEFSDICGTREECHKALDVLLDTCEADIRLGYEQVEATRFKLSVSSTGYDSATEEVDIIFTCAENNAAFSERCEKVYAARELIGRRDELVKTYEELQRSAERKVEYARKLNQLKEEYGVDE
jgi:hypothetical protein